MKKRLFWLLLTVGALFLFAYLVFTIFVKEDKRSDIGDCCFHATIYLQPYDDFTQKKSKKLKADLDKHLGEILDGSFTVEILPNKPLSDSLLGETKAKYRTDKMIAELKEGADDRHIIIGLTHKDICREYKNGVKDWGVLGSSISDYHACVVSDHRLKHKSRDLWKVVTHEFIHAFYNYGHCLKDSAHCLMKDAKGHADFSNKNGLCSYCKNKIGWRGE